MMKSTIEKTKHGDLPILTNEWNVLSYNARYKKISQAGFETVLWNCQQLDG